VVPQGLDEEIVVLPVADRGAGFFLVVSVISYQ
jgi:hypothetical protein